MAQKINVLNLKTTRNPITNKANKENESIQQNTSKTNLLQLQKNDQIKKPFVSKHSISTHIDTNDMKKEPFNNNQEDILPSKSTLYDKIHFKLEKIQIEQPFQQIDMNSQISKKTSQHKRKILDKLVGKTCQDENELHQQNIINIKEEPSHSDSDDSDFNIWGNDVKENSDFLSLFQHRFNNYPNEENQIEVIQMGQHFKSLLGYNYKMIGLGNYPFYDIQIQHCQSQSNLPGAYHETTLQQPSSLKRSKLQRYFYQKKLLERKSQEQAENHENLKKIPQELKKIDHEVKVQNLRFEFKFNGKSRMIRQGYQESKSQINSNIEISQIHNQNYSILCNASKVENKLPNNTKFVSSPQLLLKQLQIKQKFQLN